MIAGATDGQYVATASGSYRVVVSDGWGCTDTSAAVGIVVDTTVTNIIPGEKSGVRFYPNPAGPMLIVENLQYKSPVRLFDMIGKMILENAFGAGKLILDISGLERGLYLLKTDNGIGKFWKK